MEHELVDYLRSFGVNIIEIPVGRRYWLLRAQSGVFFDEFVDQGYVGIGWNEFSDITLFSDEKKEDTINSIENTYPDNKQPSHTFGQIKRFYTDISIGDVVMVPNQNSRYIAFGIVKSDVEVIEVTETQIDEGDCPYVKRRKVDWVRTVRRSNLDPVLFRMMQAHATISNATDYQEYIDRSMYSYYVKGDSSYLIVNVDQNADIPLIEMVNALQSPLDTIDCLQNPITKETYDKSDLVGKVRVQSIGTLAFISTGSAFGLALLLGLGMVMIVGGKINFSKTADKAEAEVTTDGLLEKILKFKDQNHRHKLEERMIKGAKDLKMKLPEEIAGEDSSTDEEE